MVTWRPLIKVGANKQQAHWRTKATDTFGEADQVRIQTHIFPAEEITRATVTQLNIINDE